MGNHGWLILNKPVGLTSTKVGSIIKRVFKQKKVGHAGTLDPFACGVLPLALGEATKTVPYLMNDSKAYKFSLNFGSLTSTGDIEGEVTATSSYRPTAFEIKNILPDFVGEIQQIPPIHSAIKIDGKPAYARARAGEDLFMKSRTVKIYNLTFDDYNGETAVFTVDCGTGTYIRSLGQDIAQALGTVGHLTHLKRTRVGLFTINESVSLESIQEIKPDSKCIHLLPISAVLANISSFELSQIEVTKVHNGQAIHVDEKDCLKTSAWFNGKIQAIGFIESGVFRAERVFVF